RRLFQSAVVAVFALLVFLLTLPPLFYVGQLFPSTLASGVAFGGFVLASRVLPAASTRGRLLIAAATGTLAGVLPWLHFKYALAAVALVAVAALAVRLPLRVWRPVDRRGREAWSAIGVIAGVLALSFTGIVLYCHHYFGTWTPHISAAGGEADLGPPDLPRALNLLCDMFLDPQSGLLPWVPLALVIPAGLVLLWRRDRRFAGMLLIMLGGFLGAFVPALITGDIYQGYALPSRFTVECAPYFALAVAAVLAAALPEPAVPVRQPTPQWRSPRRVSWRDVARAAKIGLALGCLSLLLAGAAFDSAALQAPQLLYHSTAGPRLVEEYPDMLPAWWFGIFPSTPGNYVTAATEQLIPDATLHQLRLADIEVPEGRYVATVTLICTVGGPEQMPVMLRTEGNLAGGVQVLGEQPMAVNCMARQPATVTLAFSSNGYQSLNFVVALPPGAPAVQASLTYRRVSSRH
ncbi:MAG TPA: hypothetical protein VGS80_24285, partial [Ktedonobacterales bacterium]|nr:hypothetical protein [Ktedonobacterales bacterium]